MPAVKNAYTITPDDIEEGDVYLFVVKLMVGRHRIDDKPVYRMYRCPWEGDESDLPQGMQIDMSRPVDRALFPTIAASCVRD